MFSKIKDFLFGSSPVQSPVASPYKVEAIPAGTEASIIASPVVEAVVVVPEAVVPAGVVDQALAVEAETVAKPKKPPAVKKPRAPKAK
jgi:hypothetical protein